MVDCQKVLNLLKSDADNLKNYEGNVMIYTFELQQTPA